MIYPDSFYEHEYTSTIKCGSCWKKDINDTREGRLTGDETVDESDLTLLDDSEPIQCDECLKQNDAHDDIPGEF